MDWRANLLEPEEPIEEGHLLVSDTPGLGYRLNPEMIEEHRVATPGTTDSSKVALSP